MGTKSKRMKILTASIQIELDSRLNEIATIEQNENGVFAFVTTRGYNGWEGKGYKSFDSVYAALKLYEKQSITDL